MVLLLPIIPSDTGLLVEFKNFQYPIKLAEYNYCGTESVNPTTPPAVVFLPVLFLKPLVKESRFSCIVHKIYSHGQFYVGVS